VRGAGDAGVIGKTFILLGVPNQKEIVLLDCRGADCFRNGRLAAVDPDLGFEPLAMQVQQRDGRHRRTADVARQPADIVKTFLRCGIQNGILAQRLETALIVKGRGFHYPKLFSKIVAISVANNGLQKDFFLK